MGEVSCFVEDKKPSAKRLESFEKLQGSCRWFLFRTRFMRTKV